MIAVFPNGWRDACDDVVEELLDDLSLESAPPIDAIAVAKQLGMDVVYDQSMRTRARFKRLAGSPTIFLKPEERPERLQWAVAHELGERLAARVFEKLERDHSSDQVRPGSPRGLMREQVANEIAGRLLLPRRWFFDALEQNDFDLHALKNQFSTASYELILLGLLRWPEWSVVTVFDNQEVTRRFSNRGSAPRLSPLEYDVWQECHQTGRSCERSADGVRVRAWAAHQDDWKRELLRTAACEEIQEFQPELFDIAVA